MHIFFKIYSTLIIAALSVTGCCFTGTNNIQPLTLELMTFNIRNGMANDGKNSWPYRAEQACHLILNHAPHILGVQEAYRFQLDYFNQYLPAYGEIGEGRNGGTNNEYCAILYLKAHFDLNDSGTFWLSDTPDTPSTHWGNHHMRICTWAHFKEKKSEKTFYVFNTHLDHLSQPSRVKSVALIMQYIFERNHQDPFILMGDFNATKNNDVLKYLEGETNVANTPVMVFDTFRILHPNATAVGTSHGFKGKTTKRKIDYIFVTPSTKVLEAKIIHTNQNGRYPSDHFPVTARVILK